MLLGVYIFVILILTILKNLSKNCIKKMYRNRLDIVKT